jgi:hypothetical protein
MLSQPSHDLPDPRRRIKGRLFTFENRLMPPGEATRADVGHPGPDDHIGVLKESTRHLRVPGLGLGRVEGLVLSNVEGLAASASTRRASCLPCPVSRSPRSLGPFQ